MFIVLNIYLLYILSGTIHAFSQQEQFFVYKNPIIEGIDPNGLRDCQVFKDGDMWYLTGTAYPHWTKPGDGHPGVPLYKSENLLNWIFVNYIVTSSDSLSWYYERFWAPEVHKINGKYYCTFNCRNVNEGYKLQYCGYAVSNSVEGPYEIVTKKEPLVAGNDLTLFQDDDGSVWAFWKDLCRDQGIQYAQIDLESCRFLTDAKIAILPARSIYRRDSQGQYIMKTHYVEEKDIVRYLDWDSKGIEGAYVLKRDGLYYLFYSSWQRGYEIGYAIAESIDGPWIKSKNNPIYGNNSKPKDLQKGEELPYSAVGHNVIFEGPDGNFWISCHGILKGENPMLMIDPIYFDEDGEIYTLGPTSTMQTIKMNK